MVSGAFKLLVCGLPALPDRQPPSPARPAGRLRPCELCGGRARAVLLSLGLRGPFPVWPGQAGLAGPSSSTRPLLKHGPCLSFWEPSKEMM